MNITLRRIGNSVGVIIPKDILDRYGLKAGDELTLEAKENNLVLTPTDEEFTRQVEIGRKFMDKYKVALQKLAE
jgi:putative addiction module antidote